MAPKSKQIGIAAMDYQFPANSHTVEELRRRKLTTSSVEDLKSFGFNKIRIAESESSFDFALKASKKLLRKNKIDPLSVDLVVYANALPDSRVGNKKDAISLFRYPASQLQYELGLKNAQVLGISQAGCVSLWSAIKVASNAIKSDNSVQRVLCVSADVLPDGSGREILYNLISDSGCAVLVEGSSTTNKIVSESRASKGFYWNPSDQQNEVITSYFPTAKHVIEDSLKKAKIKKESLKLVIPHNVNIHSWEVLASMVKIPMDKIYLKNISKYGHTVASDNIINYMDAIKNGLVKKDDYVLMFTFGFGSHWSSVVIQH